MTWDSERGLGAFRAGNPNRINPDATIWNTMGVKGVDNPGKLSEGDLLVCNTKKAYDDFLMDGWAPVDVPEDYVPQKERSH